MTTVPATLDEMFPSPYLRASDIQGEEVLTIKGFEIEKLKNRESGDDEEKTIMFFEEKEKGMVLNKTNKNTLKDLHGNVTAEVIGKRVVIWTPIVESFGKHEPALRIKNQKPPVEKAALVKRFGELWQKASVLKIEGLDDYAIAPTMSEMEIIALGKELSAKIEAAEAF